MGLICLISQLRYISDVFVVLVLVIMDTSYIFSQVCSVYLLLYFRVWSHFIIINKWYVIVNLTLVNSYLTEIVHIPYVKQFNCNGLY